MSPCVNHLSPSVILTVVFSLLFAITVFKKKTFAMLSIAVFSFSFLNTILTLKSGDRMPKLKIIL